MHQEKLLFDMSAKEYYKNKMSLALERGALSLNSKAIAHNLIKGKDFEPKNHPHKYILRWCLAWLAESAMQSSSCFNLNIFWQEDKKTPPEFQQFKEFFTHNNADYKFEDLLEILKNSQVIEFIQVNDRLDTPTQETQKPITLLELAGNFKLYLSRIYSDEIIVKNYLKKSGKESPTKKRFINSNKEKVQKILQLLFANFEAKNQPNWQKIAIAQMLSSKFGIITGGPGTGKTTTVLRLMAVLQLLNIYNKGKTLHMVLSAPTGKASARLNESILEHISTLPSLEEVGKEIYPFDKLLKEQCIKDWQEILPTQVTTIHKVLEQAIMGFLSPGAYNRFNFDLLVIDEASMLDLHTFSKTLLLTPARASIFLLGDENQLASVEAGSVLGDLCTLSSNFYHKKTQRRLEELSGESIPAEFVDEAAKNPSLQIAKLRTSHRFNPEAGIGKLAHLVNGAEEQNAGANANLLLELLNKDEQLEALEVNSEKDFEKKTLELAAIAWQDYFKALKTPPQENAPEEVWDKWSLEVFKKFNAFQFLAVTRKGNYGVENINKTLATKYSDKFSKKELGNPFVITRNDQVLGINNGDLCLLLPFKKNLQLHFLEAGKIRRIPKSRVENLEPAWCLTVHKSQGSEFKSVCLVMPQQESPILTKEIFYTALTRAKQKFYLIYTDKRILTASLANRIERWSGF